MVLQPVFPPCWQCHTEVTDGVCSGCTTLQPLPKGVDFFTLFQLPHKLNLDEARLTSVFYTLSRKNHPDFFYKKSEREQKISLDNTALINKAYRTLKDPIQRAAYGVGLVEGPSSISTEPPADLFEDILTLQEALETFKNAREDEKDPALLISQREHFTNRYEQEEEALQCCFDQWDRLYEQTGDVWTEAQKQCAREIGVLLSHRAYFERVLGDLAQALPISEVSSEANVTNVYGRRD